LVFKVYWWLAFIVFPFDFSFLRESCYLKNINLSNNLILIFRLNIWFRKTYDLHSSHKFFHYLSSSLNFKKGYVFKFNHIWFRINLINYLDNFSFSNLLNVFKQIFYWNKVYYIIGAAMRLLATFGILFEQNMNYLKELKRKLCKLLFSFFWVKHRGQFF